MKLTKQEIKDVIVISLTGQLDGNTSEETLSYFESLYEDSSKKFVADFKNVEYISSAGLRVLLAVLKDLRSNNGDLRLAALQKDVDKVLSATGFTRMMKVFSDVDEALASYSE